MEGRRSRGHRAESPRDGGTQFTQLRITLHGGRAYCCLSRIMWALSRYYNELWLSALRAPRIRLI